MTKRFDLKLENRSDSSVSVVESYRKVMMLEDFDESLALVHYRGGKEEFQLAKSYLSSDDPIDRALGAEILGQLGWQDRTYLSESVDLLIPALKDNDELVVSSVCFALGHRAESRAVPHILKLAKSSSEKIRYAVVSALLGVETKDAIDAMISLSKDSDYDVRNWAMFGLGSQIEVDTTEIRNALFIGASDIDSEIRGEALLGLAERGDYRVVDLLLSEWDSYDLISPLSLEAAEKTASIRLYSKLTYIQQTFKCWEDIVFEIQLQRAVDACKPKIQPVK